MRTTPKHICISGSLWKCGGMFLDNAQQYTKKIDFSSDLLFDAHVHLEPCSTQDSSRYAALLNEQLQAYRMRVALMTCTLDEYDFWKHAGIESAEALLGCGMHPWYLHEFYHGDTEWLFDAFVQRIAGSEIVGELGLDFHEKHLREVDQATQETVFELACKALAETRTQYHKRIISLHTYQSLEAVIKLLKHYDICTHEQCVIHRFSGTSDELCQALDAGCFFSIHPDMLRRKSAANYLRKIGSARAYIESDAYLTLGHHPQEHKSACTVAELRSLIEASTLEVHTLLQNSSNKTVSPLMRSSQASPKHLQNN